MKYLLSLFFALCVQYASCDIDFLQWSSAHGKTYKSEEEVFYRHGVFYKNMKEVDRRNSLGRSFKLALNKYADMDHKEFTHRIIHGYNSRKNYFRPHYDMVYNVQLSESVDWVSAGAVTPVKIKDNAVVVGPFQQPAPSKVHGFYQQGLWNLFPNNNWLIAVHHKEIKGVTEV